VRVVHLGRSTCHAIGGRGDESTRIPDSESERKDGRERTPLKKHGRERKRKDGMDRTTIQGYLAHKKHPPPVGPSSSPMPRDLW